MAVNSIMTCFCFFVCFPPEDNSEVIHLHKYR